MGKRVYLTSLSTYSKGLCDFFIIPIDPKKIKDINRYQKIIFYLNSQELIVRVRNPTINMNVLVSL